MARGLRLTLFFLVVGPVGCATPPSDSESAGRDVSASMPAEEIRLGPQSEREALRIAELYIREFHPEIHLSERLPTATYVENPATYGRPLWVVTFTALTPLAVTGVQPFYSQDVWVRRDGKAKLGPAHTP
jgi:hypothetical protein